MGRRRPGSWSALLGGGWRQTWLGIANAGACIESRVKLHPLDTENARRRRAALRAADIEHRVLCRHPEGRWKESSSRRPRQRRSPRYCRARPRSLCRPDGGSSCGSPLSRSPPNGSRPRPDPRKRSARTAEPRCQTLPDFGKARPVSCNRLLGRGIIARKIEVRADPRSRRCQLPVTVYAQRLFWPPQPHRPVPSSS